MQKFSVADFNKMFPDEGACLESITGLISPDFSEGGIPCRACEKVTKHHKLAKRRAWSCDNCGTHVYPLAGTIFEKSTTPLKSWLYAPYLMASTRCGISAKQLERELAVTYKTAWRMFKEIRKLFAEDVTLEGQLVELDETYVGGKEKNRHAGKRVHSSGRSTKGKTVVFGAVERQGRIIAQVVPDASAASIMPIVKEKVLERSIIYTDEWAGYNRLRSSGYEHKRVHHSIGVYVVGDAHTNTVEGFWSLLKRSLSGAHHAVSAKYLQQYLNEWTFRWNHRSDEAPMYAIMLDRIHRVRAGKQGEYAPVG